MLNMRELIYREMKEVDIPEIMKLESELFSDPWSIEMFIMEFSPEYSFPRVVKGEKIAGKRHYVLEYQGKIIAYLFGLAIMEDYSINNIAVAKDYQGKGLGSFLMDKILLECQQINCENIFLEVRKSNISAIALYEKYGFTTVGTRKNYYSEPYEDALVMKKIVQ